MSSQFLMVIISRPGAPLKSEAGARLLAPALDVLLGGLLALNAAGIFYFWFRLFMYRADMSWSPDLISSLFCELAAGILAIVALSTWIRGSRSQVIWLPLGLGFLLYGTLQGLPAAVTDNRGLAFILALNVLTIGAWITVRLEKLR